MLDFEKLGVFYLGRSYDSRAKKPKDELLLYDSRDLTTHALCVGMTGSGKTGLCIGLLEEAAIDGIPAIAIDPKGDLANLLLTFPNLSAQDFVPWINEEEARKKGLTLEDYASQQAELWKNGLAEWAQNGERIRRLRQSADFVIYTPGSQAGIPLSILKSFVAPEESVLRDNEVLSDRISGTITSLLGLLGIESDPLQSREHILLSTLLKNSWIQRKELDLPGLIQQIQTPSMNRVGVLDLDSFYPSKERFSLAMRLNNLLAAPGFEAWLEGEPLDINSLFHTPEGKPRISIISISHLNDAERMFIVSLLLNQVLSWVRTQSGTTSLRALLYMDEISGYFPPVSNPPAKTPLLSLLKQARAFGLGVVLATQNPVDLDYKGLSNTGTWFIGRLQTERDKARVLDGLEGAASSGGMKFDRPQMEQILAGLGNRIFLMNNVHEDHPEIFESRWTLSYLRGPLTRNQIKILMQSRKAQAATTLALESAQKDLPTPTSPVMASSEDRKPALKKTDESGTSGPRPVLPPEIPQFFIPYRGAALEGGGLVYVPMLLGCGKVYFSDTKTGIEAQVSATCLAGISNSTVAIDWQTASPVELAESDLEKDPADQASFAQLPAAASKPKSYDAWRKSFIDSLFRNQKLDLLQSRRLKQISQPQEPEREFRLRLQQAAREERDQLKTSLGQKYAPRIAALQEKIRQALQTKEREEEQVSQQKLQTAISVGTTLLGAILGRKAMGMGTLGKATTAARGIGRTMKESQDVARAEETVEVLEQQLRDLNAEFEAEARSLESKIDPLTETLDRVILRPKRTNVSVSLVALSWAPFRMNPDGKLSKAWE